MKMIVGKEKLLTGLDYPDPDVIRVSDTYYMVSTTMYFMPGCEILRSYDLLHWEHLCYVYESLDATPGQCLEGEENAYAKGMWAASLRHHNGKFYIAFVANDTRKTYLFTADKIEGPWRKQEIEGFYHDCSLLFDDDDSVYIVYGNDEIWLTQLKSDLSGPLPGGLHRCIISDCKNPRLGYEGAHFYKINGRYYVFLIHSRRDRWMRTEACFAADSLKGEFVGCDVLEDDMGYCGQGIAQGGIVDTPEGDWYGVLFQDRGAVGRIPVLLPVSWKEGFPVFGENGRIPAFFELHEGDTAAEKQQKQYAPLVGSDDFCSGVRSHWWQWNHEPWREYCGFDANKGCYWIRNAKCCRSLLQASNTLTQRLQYPGCEICVTLDGSRLQEGDFAGLCVLQKAYGMIAMTIIEGGPRLVMQGEGRTFASAAISDNRVRLQVRAWFEQMRDEAAFFYEDAHGQWRQLGPVWKLSFSLEHFTGNRVGLFSYATAQTDGIASFSDFCYTVYQDKT